MARPVRPIWVEAVCAMAGRARAAPSVAPVPMSAARRLIPWFMSLRPLTDVSLAGGGLSVPRPVTLMGGTLPRAPPCVNWLAF